MIYLPLIYETNFQFGRMDVHIDLVRGQMQVEDRVWVASSLQQIAVRADDGVVDHPVAYPATIDEGVEPALIGARVRGLRDEASNAQRVVELDRVQATGRRRTEDLEDALSEAEGE